MAAKRSPADTNTAQNLRLIPDADLPKFDPRLKNRSQILDQLAEIYPSVRRKIKQYFIVVKSIFRINQLHLQIVLSDLLKTNLESLFFPLFVVSLLLIVLRRCHTQYRFQRLDYFVILFLLWIAHYRTVFNPARRLHDHVVIFLNIQFSRIKIIYLAGSTEPHSYHSYHNLSTSILYDLIFLDRQQ